MSLESKDAMIHTLTKRADRWQVRALAAEAKVADAAERIALAIEAECSGCEMAMECEYQIAARIARTALTGDAS